MNWIEFLAPASVMTVVAFQFMYFASKKEIAKLEERANQIEQDQNRIFLKLGEISTKLDMLMNNCSYCPNSKPQAIQNERR